MTEDVFLEQAFDYIAFTESQFTQPDEDVLPLAMIEANPVMMLEVAEQIGNAFMVQGAERPPEPGDRALVMMPLPGDPAEPDISEPLKLLLAEIGAKRLGLIFTAYMSYDGEVRSKYLQVKDAPSAVECVLLLDLTAERLEVYTANVVRSDVPPMLAPWQHQPGEGRTELTDYLKEALT